MNDGSYETADSATNRVIMLDGQRVRGTFPTHWGAPPYDLAERGRWIRRNIREGDERMDAGERVQGQRPRTGRQLRAALERRRESPAFANAARMRLVELLERGPV